MKLKTIILNNFRSYKNETRVEIGDLTAFIGRNDAGKSTILEALEIFFNSKLLKIESSDSCVYNDNKKVTIGGVFTDLPEKLVIDVSAETNLSDEYLLNDEGNLEIHKIYDCGLKTIKESVFAIAKHPKNEKADDLLALKITDLKIRLKHFKVDEDKVDLRSNPSMRKAIWRNISDIETSVKKIPLDQEDAKKIWDELKKYLPIYALFQADRPCKDDDAEVQDPMKIAVSEALKFVEKEIEEIKDTVRKKTLEVATNTLEKLREMDEELGSQLQPNFRAEPKWDTIFKLSLAGDDQIPINKRGSGVRRLVLLNFFRAEAERKQKEADSPGIIYAIEDPEASQHPNNQKMLLEAFKELSDQDNCQILMTTHSPGFAGLLNTSSLRYIEKDPYATNRILAGDDYVYEKIATELGILPDKRVRCIICLEGPNDINFIKHFSSIMHNKKDEIPDLCSDPRIAFIPLGGGNLKHWVCKNYLQGLGLPEIHIYDRDSGSPPKYKVQYDEVNRRMDGSWATITRKREFENYLHPDIVNLVFGININFGDDDDVPNIVANEVNKNSGNKYWRLTEKRTKNLLNDLVASKMDYKHICDRDPKKEIESWFEEIAKRIQ